MIIECIIDKETDLYFALIDLEAVLQFTRKSEE